MHLSREDPVGTVNITFVKRLSNALFVLVRGAAKTQGEPEFLWQRDVKKAAG
jgi:cob(I)alamin adenosyltransferase